MNRGKFDFDKSAKLGLNKKVQKKYQDKDSVSNISYVYSIEEAIKVFRDIVDHKLESSVQVEERGLFGEYVPGKAVEYHATGLPRITLVVREWNDRSGFTVHLAGPKMFSKENKKNILKSPLLNSYVCNKEKMLMIPNQAPLFQDPIDPFAFKVEVIEKIADFFLTCIPKKFKKDDLKESSTALGLGNKVQKKYQEKDSVDNISYVHSMDEAIETFISIVSKSLRLDDNLSIVTSPIYVSSEKLGTNIIFTETLSKNNKPYKKTFISVVVLVKNQNEYNGFTIHLYSLSPKHNPRTLVLENPLTYSYISNKDEANGTKLPLLQDPEDPTTFKITVLEELAKIVLECIPKKYKRENVNESSQTSLGLSKKVQKKHQETDSVDNISCVHSPKEAIEMFRMLVDDKLKRTNRGFTIKEENLLPEPGKTGLKVRYQTPRILIYLVARTWKNRNGFTLHLASLYELTALAKGEPLTDSYIINKRNIEEFGEVPIFQDPEDPNIFKISVLEKIASMFLETIIELDNKAINESSQTSLGLSKKVQKKHEDTDSIDNVSDVIFDKPQDFIDAMKSLISNKDLYITFDWGYNGSKTKTNYYTIYYDARPDELKDGKIGEGVFNLGEICIQTENKRINLPNYFWLEYSVDSPEPIKSVWYEPIKTLFSKGIVKCGAISPAEAVNAVKFIMKMFEENKGSYVYVPEAIEESSLGMNKRVQKIHDTRDAVSEVDPLLDFNSFFNILKDFLKNKIKEHEDTRINDLFEELNKQKYAADNKDMIEIKLKIGFDFDSERITVNLYFDENSNFIKNIWSFASFLGEPYSWDIEEKFSSEFLTDRSEPLVKRGLILSASSASVLADAIIEQALAYLDSYDEMTVSSSVQESVNLGLARRVAKNHEDRDSIDAVNDVELDEDEFMKIAEEAFLKIPGIDKFEGGKINIYSDEKYKYASIFTEYRLDFESRTTTKNGYNLGISCPIYLTIRKRQDRDDKGFYLYFLDSTNTDETLSSTYQLFGVGDIGTSNTIVLNKYFKDKNSKYISDLTVGNIMKAADWLRDFIINAFPGEINESALGLNSKVSNKFKSEHTVSKEIDEMSKIGIDEFETYFTEMCSSLSFPDFKELRIKIEKAQLGGMLVLKYASTTGSDKKQKRFNGKLDWYVDEDSGEMLFTFWIDNNLYNSDNGYNSKKFGTSKKYVEKYFLSTYKNLKDLISFIEEYVKKNIKTIKKTFDDDTSLDESMNLGLSKKVQDKHEGHKEEAIDESVSSLGLASKAKKRHSEKDSITAFSELDEGAFLDMIADVVADQVGKLNDEVQKHPDLVKRNMTFISRIFEEPIENGNAKVYCCYSKKDGSQGEMLVSNLLILDLKHCYDRKPKFVTYVSGTSFHDDDTVYYSETSPSHTTTEVSTYLIQNSLSITNASGFGDFLYREIEARMERY